jgi:diguanylate cyclase (GGDEF)-like protein
VLFLVSRQSAFAENMTMGFLLRVKSWTNASAIAVAVGLIVVIGVLDYATSYELSFSLFYFLPISLLAWKNRWAGLAGSVVSAVVWSIANIESGLVYSSVFVAFWNSIARLLTFAILTLLISVIAKSNARLEKMARTDPLTGAANSRSFLELLDREIERTRRYGRSFTLCYLDLDNFKTINDSFGHSVGDAVLQTLVSCVRDHIRSGDVVVRLGGDEFAILLPETAQSSAHVVIDKIRSVIKNTMISKGWPITVSVGSLSCPNTRLGAEQLIKLADELMYQAKSNGKDMVVFSTL